MKIRLIGPDDEIAATVRLLRQVLTVDSESAPYPSRRNPQHVRVYLDIRTTANYTR